MLIEPLPDSVDALHVLFKQLQDQHATALEKIQALTEQNDKPGGAATLYYDQDFARLIGDQKFDELRKRFPDPRPPKPEA